MKKFMIFAGLFLMIPVSVFSSSFSLQVADVEGDMGYIMHYHQSGKYYQSKLKFPFDFKGIHPEIRFTPDWGHVEGVFYIEGTKDIDSQSTQGIDQDWTDDHLDFESVGENALDHYYTTKVGIGLRKNFKSTNTGLEITGGMYFKDSKFFWKGFKQSGYDTYDKPYYNLPYGDTRGLQYERQVSTPFIEARIDQSFIYNAIQFTVKGTYFTDVQVEDEDRHLLIKKVSHGESEGNGFQFEGSVNIYILSHTWIKGSFLRTEYETEGLQTNHFIGTNYYDPIPQKTDFESTSVSFGLTHKF